MQCQYNGSPRQWQHNKLFTASTPSYPLTHSLATTLGVIGVEKQVAQLWQRDRASSIEGLLFAPLRYDAIYAYASYGKQIISSTRPSCWIQISDGGCDQRCGRPSDVCDTDRPTKLTALETISRWLLLKTRKNRSLSHPLGHLGVTYAVHLWLVGKAVLDFIFVVIEHFSLSLAVETLWAEIGRSRRFSKGVGHFERIFQREGGITHQPLLVSE